MACQTCEGRCRLTTNGEPMSIPDVIDDMQIAHNRWRKALRDGKYFRAERWANMRDLALDHLPLAT